MSRQDFAAGNAAERRVFWGVALLALGSLALNSAALCGIFYRQTAQAAREAIREEAGRLAALPPAERQAALTGAAGALAGTADMRLTLVAPDGSVVFDSALAPEHDYRRLDNHAGRAEIQAAMRHGWGESARTSGTLGTRTWYYALLLPDGFVLRAARTSASIFAVFNRALPFMLLALMLGVGISYGITKKLCRYIEKIAGQGAGLSRSEKLRREFSANVSHELKTPLTSISGYAEMLESGMVKEADKAGFIQKIKDESARLLALVEDIMLLSRLDEGKSDGDFEPVNIAGIAAETARTLAAKAAEHAVSVHVHGTDIVVPANRGMMAQLFFNLIDNAIKYNKSGGHVHIDFTRKNGHITASVSDNGIGIPPRARERVFERFYRVDKSRSKKTGGTGLGLAIVKHIAIIHRAAITLDSEENRGTTVAVTFPAKSV